MEPRVYNSYSDDVPDGAVYIGRPSKWGNPFVVGKPWTRAKAIEQFEQYIRANEWLMAAAKRELKGRNLLCFCAPEPCHGDVLLRIANEE